MRIKLISFNILFKRQNKWKWQGHTSYHFFITLILLLVLIKGKTQKFFRWIIWLRVKKRTFFCYTDAFKKIHLFYRSLSNDLLQLFYWMKRSCCVNRFGLKSLDFRNSNQRRETISKICRWHRGERFFPAFFSFLFSKIFLKIKSNFENVFWGLSAVFD